MEVNSVRQCQKPLDVGKTNANAKIEDIEFQFQDNTGII